MPANIGCSPTNIHPWVWFFAPTRMMRLHVMRWKVWEANCSSVSISRRCRKNPCWLRKLLTRGNCWNDKSNYAEWRAENPIEASVCGRRAGKVERRAGEKRLADRSRSATPAAEPQTEARRCCGHSPCKLVTSARFAKWNGRRREGYGATESPYSEANRALVTAQPATCAVLLLAI